MCISSGICYNNLSQGGNDVGTQPNGGIENNMKDEDGKRHWQKDRERERQTYIQIGQREIIIFHVIFSSVTFY